eukprot:Clim_evm14s240 gene=Clim_evmTU14s240
MPRSRRSGGAARGPTAGMGAARAAPPPRQQRREHHTTTQPARTQPPQQSVPMQAPTGGSGGGLFANMASTAAGVAVGHTMGNAMSSALGFGGGGSAPEQQQQAAPVQGQEYAVNQQQGQYQAADQQNPCAWEMKDFVDCVQKNSNDIGFCQGFMESLNQCKINNGIPLDQ